MRKATSTAGRSTRLVIIYEVAYLLEDRGQHFHEAGVGLGGYDEERVAGGISHPVVGDGGHGNAYARDVCFGNVAFAVVGADMTIDIEKIP